MGGLSLFVFAVLLKNLHRLTGRENKPAHWFLFAPLLLYALDKAIFVSSTEPEVYSLNTFFILVLLLFALKWYTGNGISWLYSGAFIYGLSAGNHAAVGLYLPVLLLLTLWGEPRNETSNKTPLADHVKRIATLALFFLMGFSVYFLLLVRSQTDHLPMDFGRTDTLERFWRHLTDAKDSETHFQGIREFEDIKHILPFQIENLLSPLFCFSLPFFAWGLKWLWKNYQILSVALPLLIATNLFFFYYWIDGSSAFIPSVTAFFLIVCVGFGEFGRFVSLAKPLVKNTIIATTIVFFFVSACAMAKERVSESGSLSGFQSTELFMDDLSNLPPDSIVIHGETWFSELTLQHVYSLRPDVSLIFLSGMLEPQSFVYPEQIKYPLISFPKDPNGNLMSPYNPEFISSFFNVNLTDGKKIFINYGTNVELFIDYIIPSKEHHFLGEIKQDNFASIKAMEMGLYDDFVKRLKSYSLSFANDPNIPLSKQTPLIFFNVYKTLVEEYFRKKEYEKLYQLILEFKDTFSDQNGESLLPYDSSSNNSAFLALAARFTNRYAEAEDILKSLIETRPSFPKTHHQLGIVFDLQNKGEEAISALKTATELDPYDVTFAYHHALALAKYESISDAVKFLEKKRDFLNDYGMVNAAKIITYFRDCLLLPPAEPTIDPPFAFLHS
jgi:tetratricopeptide (TPR) repeat protein/cytochrome b561